MPAPATPDELAALYLRARDVPCPKCGYNRRDGAAAACPECGVAFDPFIRFSHPIRINKNLAMTILACVWIITACSGLINGLAITAGVAAWGYLGGKLMVLTGVGSMIATLLALYFAIQTDKHRRASSLADLMISLAAAALLVVLTLGCLAL